MWVGRSLVSTRPYRFNARGLTARSRPLRATRACLADPLPPRRRTFSGVEAVAIGSFAVERVATHPNTLHKFDSGTRTAGSGIPARGTYTSGASPIPLPSRVGTAHAHHTKSTPESVQSLQRSPARLIRLERVLCYPNLSRLATLGLLLSIFRFKILRCHTLVSYGVSTPRGHILAGANVVAIVEAVAVKRFVGPTIAASLRPVFAPSTAAVHTAHARLFSRFMDPPAAQFSLHWITLVYRAAGKDVGMQLGPGAAAVALRCVLFFLASSFTSFSLPTSLSFLFVDPFACLTLPTSTRRSVVDGFPK
ncbi:hypothetical protein B0H10DRAFT_2228768 [Mycena sp. CBHHK59/15]|nr:hypothetical protein B0H10DRAFT_2228768 [Mycena sp. CBHHK59/15]